MIIFSVDGHHLAVYKTEHNNSVFCNQKKGSTKKVNANLSGNLYGATFFFLARFARSVFKTLIFNVLYNQAQAQIHTSHSIPMLTCLLNKNSSILL